ncbi:MAG: hypothetical protein II855_02715 [Candidatus Methanomethylophilaceae archaeon]|nr:hypothetical protein [Candidatus Methanomethylophilaceae archaeon]
MTACYLHESGDNTGPCRTCGASVCRKCAVTVDDSVYCPDCMRREILNENQTLINARIGLYSEIKRMFLLLIVGIAVFVAIIKFAPQWFVVGFVLMLFLPNHKLLFRVFSWMWRTMGLDVDVRALFVDVTVYNIRDLNGYVIYKIDGSRRINDPDGKSTGMHIDKENRIRDAYGNDVARVKSDNYVEDNYNRTIGYVADEHTYTHQLSTMNVIGFMSKMMAFVFIGSFILELSPMMFIVRLIRRKLDLNKYNRILLSNDRILWDIRTYCDNPDIWGSSSAPWAAYSSHTDVINKIERRAV